MRGTAAPLQRGPFSLTIPDTVGPLTIPSGASGSGLSDDLLPWLVNVDVFMTAISQVAWSLIGVNVGNVYRGYVQGSNLNSEISFYVVLAAGTWTVELIHMEGPDHGIATIQFDGVTKGTVDAYNASTPSNIRTQVTGIAVTSTGKITLKLIILSKNASSTNYAFYLQHLQFKRTA